MIDLALAMIAAMTWPARVNPAAPASPDLDAVREAVTRMVIESFEPPCRNYWDGATYCLALENGVQPGAALLGRLREVAPGLRSAAQCREELGLDGSTTDPAIRILSVVFESRDAAIVDVVAFCLHGTPKVRRKAGKWTVVDAPGGWVGCGPVPGGCVHSDLRRKGRKQP
jgi:hypothetical protein